MHQLTANPPGHTLFDAETWDALGSFLELTPRELQVVQRVFSDLKERAIAQELGISRHTVHTYLERVYRKLRVASRVELVVRVVAAHFQLEHGPVAVEGARRDTLSWQRHLGLEASTSLV